MALRLMIVAVALAILSAGTTAAGETAAPNVYQGPPLRSLLGQRQAAVERHHHATGTRDGGWVDYGTTLSVRYENGRAVRLRALVPAGLSCIEVARWAGYANAGFPHRRRGSCEWPGISLRHRLDAAHAGRLAGGVLELWYRD